MNPFQVWWKNFLFNRKFGHLQEKAGYRLLTLYEAHPAGVKIVRLAGKVWPEEKFHMDLLEENAAAWEKLLKDPAALRLSLVCKKCGCAHAVMAQRPLGRFKNKKPGVWSSSLFRLTQPGLGSWSEAKILICPRCLRRGKASTRLF
jgi:hypothetical protein